MWILEEKERRMGKERFQGERSGGIERWGEWEKRRKRESGREAGEKI